MRVGVLDVGSNTVRLLVVDVGADGSLEPVATEKEYLGLGAEIAETGTLGATTIASAAALCRRYAKRARALGAQRAEVVVTAPGRQGDAAAALVTTLGTGSGLPVRILSSEGEGRLAFAGAVARAGARLPRVVGVVDVGGGSTEVVVGTPSEGPTWVGSADLGSLRLTRLALRGNPPAKRELAAARAAVQQGLAHMRPPRPKAALAVGGSARAVAKLVGRTFGPEELDSVVALLSRRRSRKLARGAGIDPARAETLVAGALLLAEASRVLDRSLTLARGGLREGAALALASDATATTAEAA